jgi:hypothetical protein
MSLALNETRGYYSPSFYYIWVKTEVQSDDNGRLILSPELIHEYCHYIQDITTNVGLANVVATNSSLQDLFYNAAKNPAIITPLSYTSPAASDNTSIVHLLWGTQDATEKLVIKSYTRQKETAANHEIEVIEIQCEDGTKINFGNLAIMESMAYCLGILTGFTEPLLDYPYHICHLLIPHINSGFALEPELIFALCDACLLLPNPASVFVLSLEKMKDENCKCLNMNDVYNYVFSHFYYQRSGDYLLAYEKNYNMALVSFDGYLHDQHFKHEKEWIIHRFNQAYNRRNSNPKFWIDLIDGFSTEERKANLNVLFYNIGIPLTFDIDWNAFVQDLREEDLKVDYTVFPALDAVDSLLQDENQDRKCSLFDMCNHDTGLKPHMTNDCSNSPWIKAENEKKCPFASIWYVMGLAGKPVR